jgi:hypothetical protein
MVCARVGEVCSQQGRAGIWEKTKKKKKTCALLIQYFSYKCILKLYSALMSQNREFRKQNSLSGPDIMTVSNPTENTNYSTGVLSCKTG